MGLSFSVLVAQGDVPAGFWGRHCDTVDIYAIKSTDRWGFGTLFFNFDLSVYLANTSLSISDKLP